MDKIWPEIADQLPLFVSALPAGDRIAILGFAEDADNLLLPRTLTDESRAALLEELAQVPRPSAQPRDKGQRTDLRAAADLVLETLNRPGAANLVFVFVFTDFKHEPPDGAVSKTGGISALAEKHKNYVEKTGKVVKAYAIQLPLGPDAGADVDIVAAAFGGRLTKVVAAKGSLAEWFEQVRATFAREKLKALVESDLAKPVEASATVSNGACSVSLSNPSRLARTVKELTVDGREWLCMAQEASVPAGGEAVVRSRVASYPISRFVRFRGCSTGMAAFSSVLDLPATTELARLNLPSQQAVRIELPADVCDGTPPWAHALAAVLLGGVFAASWNRWGRRKRAFDGRSVRAALFVEGQQVGPDVPVRPAGDGTVAVSLDTLGESLQQAIQGVSTRLHRVIALPHVTFRFQGSRPRFPKGTPRRGTYIWLDEASQRSGSGQVYLLKTFAENANPSAAGRRIPSSTTADNTPLPEHEDLFIHFRHSFQNQTPLKFQVRITPEP